MLCDRFISGGSFNDIKKAYPHAILIEECPSIRKAVLRELPIKGKPKEKVKRESPFNMNKYFIDLSHTDIIRSIDIIGIKIKNILLYGETGTGKEHIARYIHIIIMREPSIHITFTKFKEIWNQVDGRKLSNKTLLEIFKMARGYSLDHRSVFTNNKKQAKKVTNRTSASISDTNLLADIIYSSRIQLKHVGVTKIKQTDSQWMQLKQLVPVVNEFCERYNLKKRQGYIIFVDTALGLMGTSKRANYAFAASWMLKQVDWIINKYEAETELLLDNHHQETKYVHDLYCSTVAEMTGLSNNYVRDSLQYVNFKRARENADEKGVDYETYIEAQFEALSFCNGIPKIEDLYGDKANQRLLTYVSKYNIPLKTHKVEEDIWSKFKQ